MNRWLVGGVLAILLSGFGVLLATPQPVQACSCVVFTPPEQLEMASTVFHGRVTAMEPFTPAANSPKPWLDTAVQFEVDTVWEGAVAENIVIAVVGANEACGFEFDVGEEYLVYADGPPFYGTGWCDGYEDLRRVCCPLGRRHGSTAGNRRASTRLRSKTH